MSSELLTGQSLPAGPAVMAEPGMVADSRHTVDDEAYEPEYVEVPTYAEAFPPLPGADPLLGDGGRLGSSGAGSSAPLPVASFGKWNNKMSLKSSQVTQVFCVPVEERRFKEMMEQQFGEKGGTQAKICSNIMAETGVAIEMSLAKDESLTVVITGKAEAVMKARKSVVQKLQTQASCRIQIPKEHHRYVLGPKGKKLADLELATATKITIPRLEDNSDIVLIIGTKEGIEMARHEIQLISDEQAKLAFERLPIPKVYHPFICGPFNQTTIALAEQTGVRISVPPPTVQRDEIVVSGEKEGVHQVVSAIMAIYEEKKHKCQTVSVEVRKSQHRYVIGPKACHLSEILAETGVSVELPPLESTSETITLRGEQDKLGSALTMVYSKANSVMIAEVSAPAWLHRFIIGKKGVNVRKITQDLPKVHIEFTDGEDKITVEGPPEEVEEAKASLEELTKELIGRMAFAEIDVEQKYHRHIIGRNGANITRIKNDMGVAIRIPPDTEKSNIIRIEGNPEGVALAKKELLDMVAKMENEKSRDIIIEQRFHRTIIGQQGARIREIRERFNQVQITFPDSHRKSDVVTLRGPKTDVDKCFKYLQQLLQELIVSNYMAEVHIFKQFHKNIIGKGGATIKKIRDETDTRIDLPSENSESDAITITGKRENVEKAKARIEAIQKELANIKEVSIDIPHKLHNSMIGAKGRLIRAIMEECGGVIVHFPPEGSTSDKVIIRGPKDDVENARKQLLDLANERKEASHVLEVKAKPEYHRFLIGRGGANIRKVRDSTGARIIFPNSTDADQESITLIGKKESVELAKVELESLIKDLDNIVESELSVDPKHHRHFVARRGEVLRQIAEEFGGVIVSFPRTGVKSDKVVLKGAKECVDGAKKRILEIVADLDAQVTVECVIPQKYHRTVMGAKGHQVQEITREFEVNIKFPDRPTENKENKENKEGRPAENKENKEVVAAQSEETLTNGDVTLENGSGDSEKPVKRQDVILILGKAENCEGAKQALLSKVPITEDVNVPYDFHRFIIGQKGRDVRRMMEDHDVNISIPPADEHSDVVRITGAPENVKCAVAALEERVQQLEEKAQKNYQLEMELNAEYHPKIIGRRGAVITKIRQDHDVQIQFPEKGSETPDMITITGLEKDTMAARDDILKIVSDLEDMLTEEVMIDHRVHPRLIGSRGRAIRKIMDDYKVDIRFPNRTSDNPDVVMVTGSEDDVFDCKEHLLNLEEEYLQDVNEQMLMDQYTRAPSRHEHEGKSKGSQPQGFVVRNAPWSSAVPDTNSTTDFPEFAATVEKKNPCSMAWGPPRKH